MSAEGLSDNYQIDQNGRENAIFILGNLLPKTTLTGGGKKSLFIFYSLRQPAITALLASKSSECNSFCSQL